MLFHLVTDSTPVHTAYCRLFPLQNQFVTSFGFQKAVGTFSDISVIAPALHVAAVNISAGYYCEHSRHEYVDLCVIEKNIELVGTMVSTPSESFAYIEAVHHSQTIWDGWQYDIENDTYYMTEQKLLMPLPDTAYIKTVTGELEECTYGTYFIDDTGAVYEFLFGLEAVVKLQYCEAYSEHGMPIKFQKKTAIPLEVITI